MNYNITNCNYQYTLPSYNASYKVTFQGFYNLSGTEYPLEKRTIYAYNMSAYNQASNVPSVGIGSLISFIFLIIIGTLFN